MIGAQSSIMSAMGNVFRSALLLLIAIIVGVTAMEVILRVAGISYPLFTQADEWTGFALRPGVEGWQTDEGTAYVKINDVGMRDRQHAKEKPAGTFRVAVLGDSFAEARQVEEDETFWKLMEGQLQTCAGERKTIEVLNFGVSGFGTTQEFLQLHHRIWEYHPDLILLAFTTGNDVRNNSAALEGKGEKPYFSVVNDMLQLDLSFRDSPGFRRQSGGFSVFKQWLYQRSRVMQLVRRVTAGMRGAGAAGGGAPGKEEGLDEGIYTEPSTAEWADAWLVTEKILMEMNKEAREHGALFIVATLSNGIQVHPDVSVRDAYAKRLEAFGLFYPERRLGAIGARGGFPVFTLGPALAEIASQKQMYLHGFSNTTMGEGHWNEDGHREASQLLSQLLCAGEYF